MKKGELKRSSILKAAEMLFFERGYDRTSVQDILDALSLSKGGFYHHFPSKEAVLEEICVNRISARLDRLGMDLFANRPRPIDRLNLLLRAVNILERDDAPFVAMMLKVCYIDRDVRIRDPIRSLLLAQLSPRMEDVLRAGIDSGDFFIRHPGQMGWMVLNLANDASDEACRLLAEGADNPECVIGIADLLGAARDAIETLLGAPFGSVVLFDPDRLVSGYRAAAAELARMEAKN